MRVLRDVADATAECSAEAALARLRRGDHFDLVLCDVSMPQMSGVQLFEDAVASAPELRERFVFASGGVSGRVATLLAATGRPCIEKPMTRQAIVALLRR